MHLSQKPFYSATDAILSANDALHMDGTVGLQAQARHVFTRYSSIFSDFRDPDTGLHVREVSFSAARHLWCARSQGLRRVHINIVGGTYAHRHIPSLGDHQHGV